jgi:phosphoglycerate dehydrogenase-like enzyme
MAQLAGASVLFGSQVPDDPARFPKLQWIQLTGAGYDSLTKEQLNSGVAITNAPLFAIPIGEYVLWAMLALSKRLAIFAADFHAQRSWPTAGWDSHVGDELFGKTVGIVGYGSIGQAVARFSQAFGMNVVATRQSATTPTLVEGVRVLPAAQLPELLATSDFVVLCLPLTDATRGLVGAEQFQQMKMGAYLINIARGAIVDEKALIAALQRGQLSGAALDVFEKEPLPVTSPLFDLPNVLLTPHIAGISSAYHTRAIDYFAENLERYLAGQPLLNVISASP